LCGAAGAVAWSISWSCSSGNYDNVVLWDTIFLVFGALLLLGGVSMVRSAGPQEADRITR
jgi:uncharacterized membrane protein